MPKGNLQDLLRLAMKGPSFMEGVISLKTKIDIPPLTGKGKRKAVVGRPLRAIPGEVLAFIDSGQDRYVEPAWSGPTEQRTNR
jgi:hypothetical protein